jgi:hypothetical protein
MSQKEIRKIVDSMDPLEAASALAAAAKRLLPLLDEGTRLDFIVNLIGDEGPDREASLVHF